MKNFAAGVVVGVLGCCAVGFAAPSHDGMFWNRLTKPAKDGYVNGYADAMRVSVSKLDTLAIAGDVFHWKSSRKLIHEAETQLALSELSPEEAVKKLDRLYANQNYSDLDLGTAISLLSLRAQEGGSSAKGPR